MPAATCFFRLTSSEFSDSLKKHDLRPNSGCFLLNHEVLITLPGPSGGGLRGGLPGWWTPRSPSTKDDFKQELSLSIFSSSSPGIVSQQLLPRRWRRFSWYAPPFVCKIFTLTHICFGYSSSAQTWGKSWYQWTRQIRLGSFELQWHIAFAGSQSSRPQPFSRYHSFFIWRKFSHHHQSSAAQRLG